MLCQRLASTQALSAAPQTQCRLGKNSRRPNRSLETVMIWFTFNWWLAEKSFKSAVQMFVLVVVFFFLRRDKLNTLQWNMGNFPACIVSLPEITKQFSSSRIFEPLILPKMWTIIYRPFKDSLSDQQKTWNELNEKRPGLFSFYSFFGDEHLPSSVGIIINHYKDPY